MPHKTSVLCSTRPGELLPALALTVKDRQRLPLTRAGAGLRDPPSDDGQPIRHHRRTIPPLYIRGPAYGRSRSASPGGGGGCLPAVLIAFVCLIMIGRIISLSHSSSGQPNAVSTAPQICPGWHAHHTPGSERADV